MFAEGRRAGRRTVRRAGQGARPAAGGDRRQRPAPEAAAVRAEGRTYRYTVRAGAVGGLGATKRLGR